jgi:hypothetical protein
MSRGLVIGDVAALAGVVVVSTAHLFRKMGEVGFPKTDELPPILVTDSVPALPNHSPIHTEALGISDYPLGLPTLALMGQIDSISPLLPEISSVAEGFAPLELPVSMPKEYGPRKPAVAALVCSKRPELPLPTQAPVHKEPAKKVLGEDDLKNLFAVLEKTGMRVKEAKVLPSGATRITFDEFMGSRKIREPELVRVGGRK